MSPDTNPTHPTHEEARDIESRTSHAHADGTVPADSTASVLKSQTEETESKADKIDRVKANLPLPDDPPAASDWNSADARKVNVGSGGLSGDVSVGGKGGESGLREPAAVESSARVDGGEVGRGTAP